MGTIERYNKIVIGIDQSLKCTGISIVADGKIKNVVSESYNECKTDTDKRSTLYKRVYTAIHTAKQRSDNVIVIMERIRLKSAGFIDINVIKAMAGLCCTITDCCVNNGIQAYTVDTASWKAQVVGSAKKQDNSYGIDPKKWLTMKYLVSNGYEQYILQEVSPRKKTSIVKVVHNSNGTVTRYTYNDNKADSMCIGLYGFISPDLQKLHPEK